jgi:periplasmic copper chaperone A
VVGFPTVQTYSDGKVVRWIGPPSDEQAPAPTIVVSAANGPVLDVTGGDAGPPASAARLSAAGAPAPATTVVKRTSGASKGLGIAALILGALGLLAGGLALRRGSAR